MVSFTILFSLLLTASAVIARPCNPESVERHASSSAPTAKASDLKTNSLPPPTKISTSPTITKLKSACSKSKIVEFSTLTLTSQLEDHGLNVNTGWGTGGAARDGGHCYGSTDDIVLRDGSLQLIVPGGQNKGGHISGAELSFGEGLLGGVFEMVAQLDGIHGTCLSVVGCQGW